MCSSSPQTIWTHFFMLNELYTNLMDCKFIHRVYIRVIHASYTFLAPSRPQLQTIRVHGEHIPVHTHPGSSLTIPSVQAILYIPIIRVQKTKGVCQMVPPLFNVRFFEGVGGAHACTYPSEHHTDYSFGRNHP